MLHKFTLINDETKIKNEERNVQHPHTPSHIYYALYTNQNYTEIIIYTYSAKKANLK